MDSSIGLWDLLPWGAIGDMLGGIFGSILGPLEVIMTFITIILMGVVIHLIHQLREQNSIAYNKIKAVDTPVTEAAQHAARWQIITDHLESSREAEWKLAILEADNLLEELVRQIGYEGDTLGERLKMADPREFKSIEGAWEAHKIRNRIAHDGVNFQLSEQEARRVIGLYERVFREFRFI
jgi:hypothetical protein